MTRENILQEALKLPTSVRADVAAELLASLDEEPFDDPEAVARAWANEIERRARRALAGESTGISWDEVKRRVGDRRNKR